MLFGAHGVGKSLLAVEIAEALARGRAIEGLEMPDTRQNVLYVDLVLSDTQFGCRYSCEVPKKKRGARLHYKFSANLYRDRPLEGEDLVGWLRGFVEKEKIGVVIIDDLSLISRTDDGTRQTLELVRELRRLTRQLGISALVLADSHPYIFSREIAERDLRRTRILCAYADSVFALSAVQNTVWRHLVQTRSQAGELAWTHRSPAHFKVSARDDGFVGFGFVADALCEEQQQLACQIKEMHDQGEHSFREIAESLGISKSTAARLYGKWKPAYEPAGPQAASLPVDADEYTSDDREQHVPRTQAPGVPVGPQAASLCVDQYEHEDDEQIDREDLERYDFDPDGDDGDEYSFVEQTPSAPATVPAAVPFAAALRRRSIYDLERDRDPNGNEIFVESREEHSGKPKVWYRRRERGTDFVQYKRDSIGISGKTIGPLPFLPYDREIAMVTSGRAPPGQPS